MTKTRMLNLAYYRVNKKVQSLLSLIEKASCGKDVDIDYVNNLEEMYLRCCKERQELLEELCEIEEGI